MSYSSHGPGELIRACTDPQNSEAWKEFIRRFHKLIAGVVRRICIRWGEYSSAVVDELVQDVYLKLSANHCRLLREFQSQSPESIYGYLKVVAGNVATDYFRSMSTEKRGGGIPMEEITSIQCAGGAQQDGSAKKIERAVLLGQIDSCLQRCTQGEKQERDCLIFRLYYQEGWSAKAIAALSYIRLDESGVESAILRMTRAVREQMNPQSPKTLQETEPDEKGVSGQKPSLKGEST